MKITIQINLIAIRKKIDVDYEKAYLVSFYPEAMTSLTEFDLLKTLDLIKIRQMFLECLLYHHQGK